MQQHREGTLPRLQLFGLWLPQASDIDLESVLDAEADGFSAQFLAVEVTFLLFEELPPQGTPIGRLVHSCKHLSSHMADLIAMRLHHEIQTSGVNHEFVSIKAAPEIGRAHV